MGAPRLFVADSRSSVDEILDQDRDLGEGAQLGAVMWQFVKVTPSRTRRSRFGVSTQGNPSAAIVSNRCWSVMMKMMLKNLDMV